jgi:uncharacterized membrane protein YgdD (TMEM256/DUF423 family)
MNETEYYLLMNDMEQGPFTIGQLRSLWNAGKITSKTYYFQAGMSEWKPLTHVLSLLEPSPVTDTAPRTIKTAKSRFVYIILGVFLGLLGIHNFYAGYFRKGAIQVIVWFVYALLFFIVAVSIRMNTNDSINFESGFIVVGILVLIGDLLLLLSLIRIIIDLIKTKTDASGDPFV